MSTQPQTGTKQNKDAPAAKPLDEEKKRTDEDAGEDDADADAKSEWADEDDADISLMEKDDDPDAHEEAGKSNR